jgi:hypothetical protein
MIEILVSVCLLADADRCRDVRLNVAAQQCIKVAQFEIGKWAERNPNWSVKRWSCGRPDRTASAISPSQQASRSATPARYSAMMPRPGL